MVFGMIQRHSAELDIESTVGEGTTVRLIFAAVDAANAPAASLPGPRQAAPLNLLIVDDDPLITESLNEILVGEGNSVTIATGGQEGIDMFMLARQRHEPFDAVLTDLGMPYIDGRRVAAAVKAASPHTPVVLLTGWAQRLRTDNEIPPDVDRVLSKPPRLRELRALLSELAAAQRLSSEV
jgi:CheY-like chemotaxis protein